MSKSKKYREPVAREDIHMGRKICMRCDSYFPSLYKWGYGVCERFNRLVKADQSPMTRHCYTETWYDGPEEKDEND